MHHRLVLFGGSFNPVHHGHLITARAAAELLNAEEVLLIPSLNPPHKLDVALPAAEIRLRMLELATAGDPLFEVSAVEIERGGTSFTFDTVSHFRSERGEDLELIWLIGADTLPELAGWHRTEDLVSICRMVTLRRLGWEMPDLGPLRRRIGDQATERLFGDVIDTPMIDISATDIRDRVRNHKPIRYAVPERVERFIHEEGLYR